MPIFYKYLSVSTAKSVLMNSTLRWTTPNLLNDPYDIQFDLDIKFDREKIKDKVLARLWDAFYGNAKIAPKNQFGTIISLFRHRFPRLSRIEFDREFGDALEETFDRMPQLLPRFQSDVRAIMESTKILCLTTVPDSILMWTHYADSHKGIVLKFRDAPSLDSPWKMARAVEYVTAMPKLYDESFLVEFLSGQEELTPTLLLDKLQYTKSSEWSYEHEWRISAGDGRNKLAPYEDIPFHPLELEAIIFGCRIDAEDRKMFIDVAGKKFSHVEFLEAVKSPINFSLSLKPFVDKS